MVTNIIPTAPGIILLIAWWATLVILERRGQSVVTTERRRAEGPYSWPKAVVSGTVGFVTFVATGAAMSACLHAIFSR